MTQEQQKYREFYQQYRDVKFTSFRLCDKKLEYNEKYSYLLDYYCDKSFKLGTDMIYVTYIFPTNDYQLGFAYPAEYAFQGEVKKHEIEEIEMHVFKTGKE